MTALRPVPTYLAGLPFAKLLEITAAMVVASCTGLTLQSLDPGGGSRQLPDFDMRNDQGEAVGVLEVTTTTVAGRVQFAARARNLSWEFDELQWVWLVHVTGEVPPREIHKQISPLLCSLEQAGQTGDWIPKLPGLSETDPGSLSRPLADLGVRGACAVHRVDSGPGRVLIAQTGPAGPFSVSAVVKAAECELRKPDNIAKLSGKSGRTELFVWLDAGTAQAALCTLVLSEFAQELSNLRLPSSPGGVTAVWVAAGSAEWSQPVVALLRSDGRAWSAMELPTCSVDQIEMLDGKRSEMQTQSCGRLRVHPQPVQSSDRQVTDQRHERLSGGIGQG
jgi:hypothetical protein